MIDPNDIRVRTSCGRRDVMIALYSRVPWDEKFFRFIDWLMQPYDRWMVRRRTAWLMRGITERP